VQFYSTVPEEFASSDTEDLISFSCDDVNSDNAAVFGIGQIGGFQQGEECCRTAGVSASSGLAARKTLVG
jgi:hypothetical protein